MTHLNALTGDLLRALQGAGFGTENEVNGADLVDLINEHFPALQSAWYEQQSAAAAPRVSPFIEIKDNPPVVVNAVLVASLAVDEHTDRVSIQMTYGTLYHVKPDYAKSVYETHRRLVKLVQEATK